MRFHFSKRALKPKPEADHGELNVVPYLDVLMNLIIFVLLSMTGIASLGTVDVTARGATGSTDTPAQTQSVTVLNSGYLLEGVTIPRAADGSLNTRELTNQLRSLRTNARDATLLVAADPTVTLSELISTLDAAREDGEHHPLFPNVTLTTIEPSKN